MDRKTVLDWVAENVMGFQRGYCKGTYGGGGMTWGKSAEFWFWCDMCGRRVEDYNAGLCPNWKWPKFGLEDVIRYIGNKGFPVMVRCDPLRNKDCFTVMISNVRHDTDDPFFGLCELAYRMGEGPERKLPAQKQRQLEPVAAQEQD